MEKGLEELRAVRRLLKGGVTVTWTKVMQMWMERNEQFWEFCQMQYKHIWEMAYES